MQIHIDTAHLAERVNPDLFGFNLEVTRTTWYNGISAQIINNRKFFSYDDSPAIGGWQLLNGAEKSVRGVKMAEGASVVQTIQSAVPMHRRALLWRVYMLGSGEVALRMKVGRSRTEIFHGTLNGTKRTIEGKLIPEWTGENDCFALEVSKGEILLLALSLMPEAGTVNGLREDVIDALKALHPSGLRFPGGCYAEYCDWKQGLLPPDEREPVAIWDSEWLRGIVQGPTFGQDPQDMNLDDFVQVCRMTGAEPLYTVRLNENTPEDAARLVEYANGDVSTEYGRIRAERGFDAPFNIKRWFIGNELYFFGRGEMKSAKTVAERSVAFAKAMKAVDPSIELILCCRSNSEWNNELLATLRESDGFGLFGQISFHQYLLDGLFSKDHEPDEVNEPATEEGIKRVEDVLRAPVDYVLPNLRAAHQEQMDFGHGLEKLSINYDEWNYCWGRSGHPALALFTAGLLQMLVRHANEVNLSCALFFHPINEGLLRVKQEGVLLEDGGLIWNLIAAHRNGVRIVTPEADSPVDIAATLHGSKVYLTLINRDTRNAHELRLPNLLRNRSIVSEGYAIDRIWEKAYIGNSMGVSELNVDIENETVCIPPAGVFGLWIE